MTLNEAIAKAKADGNVQLAEWLRQARGADAAARWYTEKLRDAHRTIRKLLNDNAKLRKLVKDLHADMWASGEWLEPYEQRMRELGVEVDQ